MLRGGAIADSTPISVCKNLRIPRHRVFQGMAARDKRSTGWFFGFKLHWVIHPLGELLGVKLTPSHIDDRKPSRPIGENQKLNEKLNLHVRLRRE
ncbi:MAG: hypothetical protein CAPSK01_002661 [Candidatus Accumulibacter vicinus]|uniref:Transposase DDE domain-containing protein n=1 Tax=Candidatus Accumulibacter vicinus TaxID=2954382 RepID=A0A084Y025_9PROT|nr:MAG: hypothetical protein CAPSK01_002661 [Candidatus Accumulibacter vicinus]